MIRLLHQGLCPGSFPTLRRSSGKHERSEFWRRVTLLLDNYYLGKEQLSQVMRSDSTPLMVLFLTTRLPNSDSWLQMMEHNESQLITHAGTADEALHLASTQSFDCIVIDDTYPGIDGIAALSDLRLLGDDTPALFIISSHDAARVIQAYESGATRVLLKNDTIPGAGEMEEIIRSVVRDGQKRSGSSVSRRLLKATLDSIPDIIGIQRPDHTLVYYNKAGLTFLNLTPDDITGKKCFELISQNKPCEICATAKALRTKKIERTEKFLPEPGVHLDCRSYPVLGDDGEVIYIVEQLTDITNQRMAEEELRALSAEYETVFHGTHDAIFLIHVLEDGRFRFIRNNRAHQEKTGITIEMLQGKTPEELLGEEAGSVVSANYQQCVDAAEPIMYEETLSLPAGERVWETLLTPVCEDGHITHIIGSSRDITDSKKNEVALQESEERYRDLFEKANVLIQSVDEKGRFIFVNETWKEKLGYTEDDLLNLTLFDIIHPDSLDHCKLTFQKVISGKAVDNVQAIFLTKSKKPIFVEGNVNSRHSDGEIQTRGIFQDISQRKQAEDAMHMANRKLKLLSAITRHDILNEVMVLLGNLELADEMADDPDLKRYLERIQRAGGTIQRHIEFTRLYEGLGQSEPQWQSLTDILQKTAYRKPIPITNHCSDICIYADPMLDKVFLNLMDNTIRHGTGVTAVTITCEESNDGCIIRWADDGGGIPDDQKEAIFARGVGKHTGFGLFLSREILGITGIMITENGVYGDGASFELRLPGSVVQKRG
ncbi:MAG: PAS domain S-box protein [Methanocalculus sp. MSAO_Arc1]|nr:MAG: PAS domain S-box protein [Methanocalculus sp. MSAO_Arc1]